MDGGKSQSVELANFDGDFTPQQISNFRQAFAVFDVNKDGRISTNEIFEVLYTMGNEVSEERKRKIRDAVASVDVDGSNDLDFREFIEFMKIMDEHNKYEASNRADTLAKNVESGKVDERADFEYIPPRILVISIKHTHDLFVTRLVIWLLFLYNVVFSIGILVLQFVRPDGWKDQVPDDDDQNRFHVYIYWIRAATLVNFLHLIFIDTFTTFAVLQYFGYRKTISNFVKFVMRPIFIMNFAANILFIGGMDTVGPNSESVTDLWKTYIYAAIQIFSTFVFMSYFAYFDTYVEPAGCGNWTWVFLTDLLLLNWIRLIISALKNVVLFLLIPFNIVFAFIRLFGRICCPTYYDVRDDQSMTARFLRTVVSFSG